MTRIHDKHRFFQLWTLSAGIIGILAFILVHLDHRASDFSDVFAPVNPVVIYRRFQKARENFKADIASLI